MGNRQSHMQGIGGQDFKKKEGRVIMLRKWFLVFLFFFALLTLTSPTGCFMSRKPVKADCISFTLDSDFDWELVVYQRTDCIGIFDKESDNSFAVIGIMGPFDNETVTPAASGFVTQKTIGEKEVWVLPMPAELASDLAPGDYTMYIYEGEEQYVGIFTRSEERYVEETERIIESLNIRSV